MKTCENCKNYEERELAEMTATELLGMPKSLLNMTMEDIVLEYGTLPGFKVYVEILDKIYSAKKKALEIAMMERS